MQHIDFSGATYLHFCPIIFCCLIFTILSCAFLCVWHYLILSFVSDNILRCPVCLIVICVWCFIMLSHVSNISFFIICVWYFLVTFVWYYLVLSVLFDVILSCLQFFSIQASVLSLDSHLTPCTLFYHITNTTHFLIVTHHKNFQLDIKSFNKSLLNII